jgi:hypothetical protein
MININISFLLFLIEGINYKKMEFIQKILINQ